MDANCIQSARKMQEKNVKRIEPGGYFCNQKLDEISMLNADVLRSVDAITGINAPKKKFTE